MNLFFIIVQVEFDDGIKWIPLEDHYYHDGFELIKFAGQDESKGFYEFADANSTAQQLSKSDTHHWYSTVVCYQEDDKLTLMSNPQEIYSMGEEVLLDV